MFIDYLKIYVSCTMVKVYLVVYLFMLCKDWCGYDQPTLLTLIESWCFEKLTWGQQLFLKIVSNVRILM